ncbi:MAG: MaoC family dehydratase [Myxococcota bacterium]
MAREVRLERGDDGKALYRLTSHRRTLTETDIVQFVNLVGLHEPPFIDMDWVEKEMPGIHNRRFAPAPLLISLGMGLVATRVTDVIAAIREDQGLGPFHGMVGVEARVKNPAFPGDTLWVELAAGVDRTTSRGQTIVALEHVVKNQRDETVVVFTERILFDPAS